MLHRDNSSSGLIDSGKLQKQPHSEDGSYYVPAGLRQVSAAQISSLSSLTAACFLTADNFLFLLGIFSAEPFAVTVHHVVLITQAIMHTETKYQSL